jgi:hypothetical protein
VSQTAAVRELSQLPTLRNHWVALDFRASHEPGAIALKSGARVIDYDSELHVLCARLHANRESSLTIVYAGNR